jgi:ribosomal protein L34E
VKYGPNNTSWRPFEKSVDQRIESAKYQRNWRAKNARSVRSNTLKSHYGIDIDVYESMLDLQDHKCAICGKQEGSIQANGKPFSLAVDHCHESKKIRGLLCSNCNRGLGIFGDNIATLLRAIEYLKQ